MMRRRSAFTLLEILVALSLFTVGMVSIIQIFPANRRLITQTGNATQAVFLAQEQLESTRAQPYEDLTVGTYAARAQVVTDATNPLSIYDRMITVSYIDGNRQPSAVDVGLKKVDVTMYWTEHEQERTLNLSTYVTR